MKRSIAFSIEAKSAGAVFTRDFIVIEDLGEYGAQMHGTGIHIKTVSHRHHDEDPRQMLDQTSGASQAPPDRRSPLGVLARRPSLLLGRPREPCPKLQP